MCVVPDKCEACGVRTHEEFPAHRRPGTQGGPRMLAQLCVPLLITTASLSCVTAELCLSMPERLPVNIGVKQGSVVVEVCVGAGVGSTVLQEVVCAGGWEQGWRCGCR